MANNNNLEEYLVYLKENARELRNLGKQWGMTEEEIDNCVTEALSVAENKEELKKSSKNRARKCWSCFLFLLKIHLSLSLVLIFLFGSIYVATYYHEPTQRAVVTFLMPYSYEIMRFVRLTAVPLHGMFNISSLYNAECLVNNPFYEEIPPDCNICRNFKQIKGHNASEFSAFKFSAYLSALKPVKLMNTFQRNVTYGDLRTMYQEFQTGLAVDQHIFTSSVPEIQSLQALFDEDRQEEIDSHETLHIDWHSTTVKASAGLRTLFPRPQYLPPEAEVTLEKHVLIDGPNTTTYRMINICDVITKSRGLTVFLYQPTMWNSPIHLYTLGSGNRRILVRPVQPCKEYCNSMLVFMHPGDSLLFNSDMWRAYLATNGNETSVGYMISVQV